ncbi:MAG: hypothetical protein RLZZ360_104 [Candidatus Parcubacteria bacterium]|jgi:hypothetical protein
MGYNSTYHSLLRIASAVVALMLVFEGGLLSPLTARLADNTELYLANAVGVSVGVAPTELNQMTAALTARDRELDARELAVAEREIEVGLNNNSPLPGMDSGTFILTTILFILLVLIVLNYALDYVRARERRLQIATTTPIPSV